MPSYSIATTKDKLSSLIDKALAGEEVIITRHGKPTVALHNVNDGLSSRPSPADAMKRLTTLREAGPKVAISSADLVRQMRDEGIG